MKRLLTITIVILLSLSLAACGSNSTSKSNGGADSAKSSAQEPAKSGTSVPAFGETKEATVNVGGNTATVKMGDSIGWDESKMGGLPKPEGVTVVTGVDMSKITGKNSHSYSYMVTGLTKENYEKYLKILKKDYTKVLFNSIGDSERVFNAYTADEKQLISIGWKSDNTTVIQYTKE